MCSPHSHTLTVIKGQKVALESWEFRGAKESREHWTKPPVKENSLCTETFTTVSLVISEVRRSWPYSIPIHFCSTILTTIKTFFVGYHSMPFCTPCLLVSGLFPFYPRSAIMGLDIMHSICLSNIWKKYLVTFFSSFFPLYFNNNQLSAQMFCRDPSLSWLKLGWYDITQDNLCNLY